MTRSQPASGLSLKLLFSILLVAATALQPGLGLTPLAAQEGDADSLSASDVSAMSFRNLGGAFMSGRIVEVAVDPTDKATWYVAAASGGVWKTGNAGVTWRPIFDRYGSYSIGCVTVDPKNPWVVWVGTGDNANARSSHAGLGVFKSDAGGRVMRRKDWRASSATCHAAGAARRLMSRKSFI